MSVEVKTCLATLCVLAAMVAMTLSTVRGGARPAEAATAAQTTLIVPVDGVRPDALVDSFGAPRGGGRTHEGIDIPAPSGTIVRAAAAGTVVKFLRSPRGGLSLYQRDRRDGVVYYYAHLDAYAPRLKEGDTVAQGQVIAFVGATGNATTPHLHFEIQRVEPDERALSGDALNPYPPLRDGRLP